MKKTKSGKFLDWTPIFDQDKSGYYAGVDKNGKWYADTAEGLKSLEEGGCLGILGILEVKREEFDRYLTKKIQQSNLPSDGTVSELASKIVHLSFGISTYWAELGIEWLKENEMNEDVESQLNKLIENKMYSQKFRHKAFAKVKRFERNKTNT